MIGISLGGFDKAKSINFFSAGSLSEPNAVKNDSGSARGGGDQHLTITDKPTICFKRGFVMMGSETSACQVHS